MKPIFKMTFFISSFALSACNGGGGTGSKENTNPVDYDKFPLMVKDYSNLTYEYGDAELSNPFWKGNVIYNETVLMTKGKDGKITGSLAYKPLKILSVKDFTLKNHEYVQGQDFEVEDHKLTMLGNSQMPYLEQDTLEGKYLPEKYNLVSSIAHLDTDCVLMGGSYYSESDLYYGHQVSVSYVYDVNEIYGNIDVFPTYNLDKLPKTKAKLDSKQDITIAGIGDSVLEGCSSSKKFNHEPFLDNFMDLTKTNLERLYGNKVTMKNLSVGGTQSAWGAEDTQINKIAQTNCDLLFVHFGINDLGASVGTRSYYENIEAIVLKVREKLPDVEILLITPFGPNPSIYDYEKFDKYNDKLNEEIVNKISGVDMLDVFSLSKELYKNKKYQDLTANGINHVNDYASRLYLSSILAKFYEY